VNLFRPGISQRNRAIPDLLLARRIRIEPKIAEPLELIGTLLDAHPQALVRILRFTDFERMGLTNDLKSPLASGSGTVKEPIVQANFCIDRSRDTHPVNSALHFATRSRTA